MFGFDGSTKAIVHFLEQIRDNKEGDKLNHREVRAYGRLMLNLLPALQVDDEEKIQVLLASISSAGLPHYEPVTALYSKDSDPSPHPSPTRHP